MQLSEEKGEKSGWAVFLGRHGPEGAWCLGKQNCGTKICGLASRRQKLLPLHRQWHAKVSHARHAEGRNGPCAVKLGSLPIFLKVAKPHFWNETCGQRPELSNILVQKHAFAITSLQFQRNSLQFRSWIKNDKISSLDRRSGQLQLQA